MPLCICSTARTYLPVAAVLHKHGHAHAVVVVHHGEAQLAVGVVVQTVRRDKAATFARKDRMRDTIVREERLRSRRHRGTGDVLASIESRAGANRQSCRHAHAPGNAPLCDMSTLCNVTRVQALSVVQSALAWK